MQQFYADCATKSLPFSMFFLSSGKHASMSFCSSGEIEPTDKIFSTPFGFTVT